MLGATDAIKGIIKLMICDINSKKPGIMIPIPQYPVYSATLTEFDMVRIDYYLNESTGWGLEINELKVNMYYEMDLHFTYYLTSF